MSDADSLDKPRLELPESYLTGSKRANIRNTGAFGNDWFVGYGKDRSCHFEGSWHHMVVIALRILSSDNTKNLVDAVDSVPDDVYRPELGDVADDIENYTGKPYKTVDGDK